MPSPAGTAMPRSWRVRRLGPPEQALSFDPVPARPPGPGEARIAVRAAGLNFPDLLLCRGSYQERPVLPFSPGFEAAGIVAEAGPGAAVRPGEQVLVVPELPNGALQESITVPAAELYPVPDDMPATVAAVLHIAYCSAHFALHRRGHLQPGQTLLVTGAAGGVGLAAVQLGREAGARVIALVTGAAKAAAVAGAADTVIDLAAEPDPVPAVQDATGGRGADVIVDVVGGELFGRLCRCVAFEGRVVVTGFAAGSIPELAVNHPLLRNYSVTGLHLARYRRENPALLRRVHGQLVALWARGAIEPRIHAELPMSRVPAGLALLAGRKVAGRVVVIVGAG